MADTARDPQALERDIERTRAELARTVDALVDRVNPRTAARRGVRALKEEAEQLTSAVGALAGAEGDDERRDRGAALLIGAGIAFAVGAVAVMVWRRRGH